MFCPSRRMARPLRVHIPGMQYHVVSRGNEKGCIFVDDEDCQSFMELLRAASAEDKYAKRKI